MIVKMKKAFQYFNVRMYELKICFYEYRKGRKLGKSAFEVFYKNSMLVEVHSVEKGLGLKNTQPGHSSRAVTNLINKLFGYLGRGYDINDFAYRETFRVIMAYFEYQEQFNVDEFVEYSEMHRKYNVLCEKLGDDFVNGIKKELSGGATLVSKEELNRGKEFDFSDFISTRHSIRMYEDREICLDDIRKAVEIANKSPSACNRQPSYVYFCSNRNKVNQIDNLITGSSGFKGETPNYIVVTTDRAQFMREEQFQWYINGGIYLSYLTLALHSLGIGNCIMQWKAFYKTEKELKELLGISAHEAIIAIVGCGYYGADTKCICAQRKKADDNLKVIG